MVKSKQIITYRMKAFFKTFLATFFIYFQLAAQQVPYGFNYQSIARDAVGLPITSTPVQFRISIIQTTTIGGLVYQETQTQTTNQFGLVNLVLGQGTKIGGSAITFSEIDWSLDKYFIQVEVNNSGTYSSLGYSQFQSVPYALTTDNALKIQNQKISSTIPTNGQFLKYNSASNQWEAAALSGANGGTVTSVTGLAPISVLNSTTTPLISIAQATSVTGGFLSSSDFIYFLNKQNQIVAGDGILINGNTISGTSGLIPGSGISILSNVISNTSPDQIITLVGAGLTTVSGTYPNFMISSSSTNLPTSISGVGISVNQNGNAFTLTGLAGIATSLTGLNGILVNQNGSAFSVDGANFIQTIVGLSGIIVNQIGSSYSISGLAGSLTTLVGINGATVTGTNNNYTINGQNLVAGNNITITGNSIIGAAATPLTSLTGLNGILVNQNGSVFSVDGSNFIQTIVGLSGIVVNHVGSSYSISGLAGSLTTLVGINGTTVTGTNNNYTINGQNLVAGNNITITGNTINAANVTPLTSISGVGIGVNQNGNAFTLTGLAGIATSLTGLNGILVNQNGSAFSVDGANFIQTIVGLSGIIVNQIGSSYSISGLAGSLTTLVGINGTIVTGTNNNYTINGQNLVAGNNITITGNTINAATATPLTSISGVGISVNQNGNAFTLTGLAGIATSLTGLNGILVNQNGSAFSVDGANFIQTIVGLSGIVVNQVGSSYSISGLAGSLTTLVGINGTTVTGTNNNYTINGQNLVAGNNITITGNTINAANATPLTSISGVGISVNQNGNAFTLTGLAGIATSLTGLNGILVNQNGSAFSVDGANFIQTIVGLSGIIVNQAGSSYSISGLAGSLTTLVGINGTIVTGTNNNYTINGQNLVAGNNITITGNTINAATPTPLTSLTGLNGILVNQNGSAFSVDGSNFIQTIIGLSGIVVNHVGSSYSISGLAGSLTTLVGINGTTVTGTNNNYTINGQNLVAGNNITITGNTINAATATPLTSISGVGIGVNQNGNAFTLTGLAGIATSLTGLNGIFINQNGSAFSVDGANFIQTIVGLSGIVVNQVGSNYSISGLAGSLTTLLGINGTTVTGTNNNYTINGQNLVAGNNITITGNSIIGAAATPLTSITGLNGLGVTQNGASFSVSGSNFVKTIVGGNNIIVNNQGQNYTINGIASQWTTAGINQISYSGNTSTTGIGYFGTIIGNNLTGAAGSIVTVDGLGRLGIGTIPSIPSQWITTVGGIYYPTNVGINGIAPLTASGTALSIKSNGSSTKPFVIKSSATGNSIVEFTEGAGNGGNLNLYNGANSLSTFFTASGSSYFTNGLTLGSNANTPSSAVPLFVVGHSSVTGTGYFGTIAGLALNGAAAGSVVTVDGAGKLGFGTIYTNNQWSNVSNAFNTGINYSNSFVGIGSMPTAANDASLAIRNTLSSPVLLLDGSAGVASGSPALNFWTAGKDASIFIDANDAYKLKFAAATTIDNAAQRISNTRMTIDANNGNVGIGTSTPNQTLAVLGNSSVTGIGYFGTIVGNNLVGAPMGSIVTTDGLGSLGYGTLSNITNWSSTTTGITFSNDKIAVGTTTVAGGAAMKVQGDLSAGGMVLSSHGFINPISAISASPQEVFTLPIYIPAGTNRVEGVFHAAKSGGSASAAFVIGGTVYSSGISALVPANSIPNAISLNGVSGWTTLKIQINGDGLNSCTIYGFTLIVKD
jgi:hypothetical protein